MALDHLGEAFAGRDPVPARKQCAHFVGDLGIDDGALLATGGSDVCGSHYLGADPSPEGDENRRRDVYRNADRDHRT